MSVYDVPRCHRPRETFLRSAVHARLCFFLSCWIFATVLVSAHRLFSRRLLLLGACCILQFASHSTDELQSSANTKVSGGDAETQFAPLAHTTHDLQLDHIVGVSAVCTVLPCCISLYIHTDAASTQDACSFRHGALWARSHTLAEGIGRSVGQDHR